MKTNFNASTGTVSSSVYGWGISGSGYYIHGGRTSNDMKWVVGGVLQSGNRHIYLWPIGGGDSNAVKLTSTSGNNRSPSLYVFSGGTTTGGTTTGGTTTGGTTTGGTTTGGTTSTVITAPVDGSTLSPGQSVTATGTGTNLSCEIDVVQDGLGPIATGTGSSITFTVPSTGTKPVQIKLTGDGGTVIQVYNVVAASGATYGDANGDGSVTMADLNTLVDWILGRVSQPAAGSVTFLNADVNGNSSISMADLNLLVDFILGRINKFPVEP